MSNIKERPILFSTSMVQAILEGRKTQTRRTMKQQPFYNGHELFYFDHPSQDPFKGKGAVVAFRHLEEFKQELVRFCPYGQPGDRLWVRETWQVATNTWCTYVDGRVQFRYKADKAIKEIQLTPEQAETWLPHKPNSVWKPSLFMPRAASRLLLEITAIRVERLQDISQEDAFAEGVFAAPHRPSNCGAKLHADMSNSRDCGICSFKMLWININGGKSWFENPWVWVVEFRRVGNV